MGAYTAHTYTMRNAPPVRYNQPFSLDSVEHSEATRARIHAFLHPSKLTVHTYTLPFTLLPNPPQHRVFDITFYTYILT